MKNKKLIIKIGIVLVGCVALFILYKIVMLAKYNSNKVDFNTDKIFEEKIIVSKTVLLSDEEVLEIGKMSLKNFFVDYEDKEGADGFKVKYDENGKIISFYSLSKTKQYIEVLNVDSFELYSENRDKEITVDKDTVKFLKENKIKNDIDFFKYIKENYYLKNNIFSSVKTMKNNYLVNSFVEVAIPELEKIVLIEGEVEGYIYVMKNNIKEIHILKDKEEYRIVLAGDDLIKDEFILSLLETINF